MKTTIGKTSIEIFEGDITEKSTDAIVNPANSSLMGGGGVDGAIHRKGGASILSECERIRKTLWPDGLPTGKAVITGGGRLKAKFVIHTVGPVWSGGRSGEPELLADCYSNCLTLAASKNLGSLAFPAISTGAFGYPMELASEVALRSTRNFLTQSKYNPIKEISFVLFTSHDVGIFEESAKRIFAIRL